MYNNLSRKILKDFRVKKIDHVIFNTLKHPVKIFDSRKQPEEYHLDNIQAFWYKSNNENYNRVLSTKWISSLPENIKHLVEDRYDGASVKEILSHSKYKEIYNFSPYVAWTLVNKTNPNHIVFEVNDITICEKYRNSEYEFSEKNHSIYLISKDGLIIQTSLIPEKSPVEFSDGIFMVPTFTISFIERHREGFDGNIIKKLVKE